MTVGQIYLLDMVEICCFKFRNLVYTMCITVKP
uniref:Uncharacterized protein n=1 Tax=Rhizophora mucronata TaxID=61149 RepID=A0A2P2P8Y5_RHIMU